LDFGRLALRANIGGFTAPLSAESPGTEGAKPFIHLTITDANGFAQAFVIIEARVALEAGGTGEAAGSSSAPSYSTARPGEPVRFFAATVGSQQKPAWLERNWIESGRIRLTFGQNR
jgi:hypothetical protein